MQLVSFLKLAAAGRGVGSQSWRGHRHIVINRLVVRGEVVVVEDKL